MKLFEESRKINDLLKPVEEKYKLNNQDLQEEKKTGLPLVISKFVAVGHYFFSDKKPKYLQYVNPNKNTEDNRFAVKVLYCIDGDTFIGVQNNEEKSYRLSAIDTPELGQPWAKESKALLQSLIDKKVVYIKYFGLDKYGRKVVDCFLDPERKILVNNALIQEGMSHYHNYIGVNKFKTHNFLEIMKKKILYYEALFSKKGRWSDNKKSLKR